MEEIVCDICVREFNEDEVIPRVLECGHSLCSDCIAQLLDTSRCCPKCCNELTNNSCEEYLVNCSLIQITNAIKDTPIPKSVLRRQIDLLQNAYVAMETKWTEKKECAESNLNLISDRLSEISEALVQLQELNEMGEDDWHIETTNGIILDLKSKLIVARKVNAVQRSPPITLKNFETPKQFLLEVYNGIIKGDSFYAVTKIANKDMYGKITSRDNKMFLHAFGPADISGKAKLVSLQDIKKCLNEGKFGAFIDIICNAEGLRQRIHIKTLSTILTPHFLRFCTGESGPVYKGCPYYKGTGASIPNSQLFSIIKVDKLIESDEAASEYMAYDNILKFSQPFKSNDIAITTSLDGDFEIFKLFGDGMIENAIGKIDDPVSLETLVNYEDTSRIIDSGIVITL